MPPGLNGKIFHFKEKKKMKKTQKVLALIITLATICMLLAACGGGKSIEGTYYAYENGQLDKENYWIIESDNRWTDSDGMTGTYELDGTTIIISAFGMEFYSGTIEDGKLTIGDDVHYIEGKEPTE